MAKFLNSLAILAVYLLVILAIGALIVLHALIPEDFVVDSTSVALLTVLIVVIAIPYLPLITRYVAELTIMGNTIKFREVIQRAEEQLEVVTSEAERRKEAEETAKAEVEQPEREEAPAKPKKAAGWPGFVPIDDHLYRLVEQDPRLAVAGLGIELEQVLRGTVERRGMGQGEEAPRGGRVASLSRVIRALESSRIVTRDQAVLLLQLVELRNLAVHGKEISRDDAYRFFSIVERLNDSVSLGYSLHVHPNENWEEQGLTCRWEHCIEQMPLQERSEASCGLFGHDCPGGSDQVAECSAQGLFEKDTPK